MSTRDFSSWARHAIAAGVMACFVSGCAATATRPTARDAVSGSEGLQVIDAHLHARFTGEPERTSGLPQTRQGLIDEMREAGVVGGVAHVALDFSDATGEIADLGLIRCAPATPKAQPADLARVERGLRSGAFRCVKVYLGYTYQFAFDAAYEPYYRMAERHDVPVVFHTGDIYDEKGLLKYADPLTIDEVAVKHPRVRFVIAHCGNPWIESAAEVAYKNPNVFLDGSALMIGDLSKAEPSDVEVYVERSIRWVFGYVENPTKLMYGSDWPLTKMKPYLEAFKRAIPREHWSAVFHDNAVRVFKLDRPLASPSKAR